MSCPPHPLPTLGASLPLGDEGRTQSYWGCGGSGRGLSWTEAGKSSQPQPLRGRTAGVSSNWSGSSWWAGMRDCEALPAGAGYGIYTCACRDTQVYMHICRDTHESARIHTHPKRGSQWRWSVIIQGLG